MKYKLTKQIKIRHESFGSILLDMTDFKVRFFNEFATDILTSFYSPIEVDTLKNRLLITKEEESFYDEFIQNLIEKNWISTEFKSIDSSQVYFSDISDFSPNYFYSPLGIEIEYTMKCSRNCTYCAYSSNPTVNTKLELTSEDWKKILDDLHKAGVFFIRFTGGDPLTREDFFESLAYADKKGFVLSVGTDLTLFTEEDALKFAKLKNLALIQTTLDGSTKEINDKMRGNGNYNKVIEGIKLLNKYRIPFLVGSVLRKSNTNDIGNIAKLVGSLGASGYCFAPLYEAGRGIKVGDEVPTNEDLKHANKQLKEMVEKGFVKPIDWVWYDKMKNTKSAEFESILDNQPFLARIPDKLLRINPQGQCYSSIKLSRYVANSEIYCGSIVENSIIDIWHNSENINSMRKMKSEKTFFGQTVDLRQLINH